MSAACVCLQGFYDVCETAGFVLNDVQARLAQDYMGGFLVHYQWLNHDSAARSLCCFHFVPKFHYAKHLAEEAKYLNPRYTWTYRAEDFIGKMSLMASSCIKGTRSTRIAKKSLVKYRFYLHLALEYLLHDDL